MILRTKQCYLRLSKIQNFAHWETYLLCIKFFFSKNDPNWQVSPFVYLWKISPRFFKSVISKALSDRKFLNKKFIKYIYIVIFCSMYGFIFPLFLLSNTQGPDHLLFSNNIQNIKSFVVFEDFSKCRLQSVLHQI